MNNLETHAIQQKTKKVSNIDNNKIGEIIQVLAKRKQFMFIILDIRSE